MTKEEKQLLLIDLCARLPYHPILNWKFLDNTSKDDELKTLSDLDIWWITKAKDCEVKPYLRPISSMTEEEKNEYKHMLGATLNSEGESIMFVYEEDFSLVIDWLNAHHFDYRGLIPMGLALEAPEDMYKTG